MSIETLIAPAPATGAVSDNIEQDLASYDEVMRRNDTEHFAGFYDADAIVFPAGGKPYAGT
jgi:ketosteroid isomerase-like protein